MAIVCYAYGEYIIVKADPIAKCPNTNGKYDSI